jgi:hypothetical protein
MQSDCIASRLKRESINPRYKNVLSKRFLIEDFNSRSPQLLKDIRNLIRRKENDGDRFKKSKQTSVGN